MFYKNKAVFKLFIVIILISLLSCSKTPSITQLAPITATSTPVMTGTPTVAVTQSSENILKNKCYEVLPTFPSGVIPNGILALSSPDGLSLLNFGQQTQRKITGTISTIGISPNKK